MRTSMAAAMLLGTACAMGRAAPAPRPLAGPPPWQWVGTGVQRYACAARPSGGFAWHLVGPDAVLTDAAGQVRGRHGVGPSWQAEDGSRITGAVVKAIPAPRADAIPWLVLLVRTHEGQGRLSDVAAVLRLDTRGGAAPASGCDAAASGHLAAIPYQARYVFVPALDRAETASVLPAIP